MRQMRQYPYGFLAALLFLLPPSPSLMAGDAASPSVDAYCQMSLNYAQVAFNDKQAGSSLDNAYQAMEIAIGMSHTFSTIPDAMKKAIKRLIRESYESAWISTETDMEQFSNDYRQKCEARIQSVGKAISDNVTTCGSLSALVETQMKKGSKPASLPAPEAKMIAFFSERGVEPHDAAEIAYSMCLSESAVEELNH